MTRQSVLLLLAAALVIGFGCGTASAPLREQGELQGKVYVVGNDPFTRLALALDDAHSVVLICTPDVEKNLRSHQGELVRVTYDGTSQVPEGQAVRVTTVEKVTQ